MALTDLSLAQLREFEPDVHMPQDFKQFWESTLEQTRSRIADVAGEDASQVRIELAQTPFEQVDFYDFEFPGFNGDPIRAWLSGPAGFMSNGTYPVMLHYHGYGGGRGIPGAYAHWPMAGYIHVSMDSRGQGGDFGGYSATPDPHPASHHARGFMSNGIESRDTYYYRRLITDAVMAVDAILDLPTIDRSRIYATGASQGGGLALAVGALHKDIRAVLPDVAFLCNFRRGVDMTDQNPFRELARFFNAYPDQVDHFVEVLNYFDGVNFSRIATKPALFSVGLMDEDVPPSTTFSAFNVYSGEKEIEVYPFAGHEGGGLHHFFKQARWIQTLES